VPGLGDGLDGPPGSPLGEADGPAEGDGPTLGTADGVADTVGDGVEVSSGTIAGPDDTMSATDVPSATDRPATGSVEMTAPSGTDGSAARVVDPTRRPAVVMVKIASD
jgi:hypothetical protein